MEEKLRFVFDHERDEQTMTELCQRYGIARETGYEWVRGYRAQGVAGLVELDRAARRRTRIPVVAASPGHLRRPS